MFRIIPLFVLLLFATAIAATPFQNAQTPSVTNTPPRADVDSQRDRVADAAEVMEEIMGIRERTIPEDLMKRADAIAVIPHVVKAAFGFGGRWGKGLVSHRQHDGTWSTPAFIDISGGSFGLQLGVEAQDLVLIFTDHHGVKGLLKGKVKLTGTAAAAAGPYGRNAEAGTDVLLRSPIVAYSRSKGLFAGISLDGSVVSIDDSGNQKVYGKALNAEDILLHGRAEPNDVVMPYINALKRYSPSRNGVQASKPTP